tara:strand:+ start:51655 stop:52122 length:468 start_codon:yes stop_codon:yes gene_type:complete
MVKNINIQIGLQIVSNNKHINPPSYQTIASAGADLSASPDIDPSGILINPKSWKKIPTGIALAIPVGFEGQIRPRSGIAMNHGVTVLNAPGTIDSDYRGEICVLLINLGESDFTVKPGDRIAQIVISEIQQVSFNQIDILNQTQRNNKGFGSTGV